MLGRYVVARLPTWLLVFMNERLVPLTLSNKLKILIGFYQLATKVSVIYAVVLPARVSAFLSTLEIGISFNLDGIATPLTCLGWGGYLSRLQFWMALPAVLALLVLVGAAIYLRFFSSGRLASRAAWREQLLEASVPLILRIMFLSYPVVTTVAFAAWPCYTFEQANLFQGASYLIADVNITCGSDEHRKVQSWAWIAVCLYPVGALATCAVLLAVVRRAVVSSKPTPLSRAVAFLYREYKPGWHWWELMEMTRRLFLVGVFSLYPAPGSLAQIVSGTLLCAIYVFLQQQASPYASISDDYVAKACTFFLLLLFGCCVLFNLISLLEQPELASLLSESQRQLVNLPLLAEICLAAVAGAILVTIVIVVLQIRDEERRRIREAKASLARRLRIVRNEKEAYLAPIKLTSEMRALNCTGFHLFLSHVWGTGQDQMRVVKQRLLEMLPDVRVFLDVDDLKTGRGAEYVDISNSVLVFISKGYFSSPNCMREMLRAMFDKKPIITLIELDKSKHGAVSSGEVLAGLTSACEHFESWGLAREMMDWGFPVPTPEALYSTLIAAEPIEWNRIGAFQDVTLRLIAERILPSTHPKTFVQGELVGQKTTLPPLKRGKKFHCYVSPYNRGGRALMTELAKTNQWQLVEQEAVREPSADTLRSPTVTTPTQHETRLERRERILRELRHGLDVGLSALSEKRRHKDNQPSVLTTTMEFGDLKCCDFMLVYLTAHTWTSGSVSAAFGEELMAALDAGVQLLLVHEMTGNGGQGERGGVPFESFFACENGQTPQELLRAGIYKQIAVPLKGGAWREASMVMLSRTVARYEEEGLANPLYWIGGTSVRFGTNARLSRFALRRSSKQPSFEDGSTRSSAMSEADGGSERRSEKSDAPLGALGLGWAKQVFSAYRRRSSPTELAPSTKRDVEAKSHSSAAEVHEPPSLRSRCGSELGASVDPQSAARGDDNGTRAPPLPPQLPDHPVQLSHISLVNSAELGDPCSCNSSTIGSVTGRALMDYVPPPAEISSGTSPTHTPGHGQPSPGRGQLSPRSMAADNAEAGRFSRQIREK